MFSIFGMTFGTLPNLASFDASLSRDKLIQNGRIIVIDDENPLIVEELQKAGFSIDHDQLGEDLTKLDNQLYDVAIIDFHGVGRRLGASQGLDLLKHIKRVSPRTRLIAYTSRSLNSAESEFFRLSHVVMPKDMGLGDSMALVEDQLRLAFSKEHLFEALLKKLNLTENEDRKKIQIELIKSLTKGDENGFKKYIIKIVGVASEKSIEYILGRLF